MPVDARGPSRRTLLSGLGAAAVAASAAGCDGSGPSRTDPAPGPTIRDYGGVSDVVTGLTAPWSIAWAAGTPLLTQRDDGRIRRLAGGRLYDVLTVPGVRHRGEGGLLGIAARGDLLAIYYTGDDSANHVVTYQISGSGADLRLSGRKKILDGIPAADVHNGGRIAFGPDSLLYVATGDSTQRELAQDRHSLAGKILRVEPNGAVPQDNPFPGSRVWSMGHRNVQGLAWSADRTMFAAEFGQDTWDELNVIVPGGNYGWPVHEGRAADSSYRNPVQQWPTGEASPSGIAILGDTIFIACLRGERLLAVPVARPSSSTSHLIGSFGRLRDVVVAPDRSLWVLTNNTDGRGTPRAGDDRILRVNPKVLRPA